MDSIWSPWNLCLPCGFHLESMGEGKVHVVVPEAAEGRGMRIRKETEYVKLLKAGSGTTGTRTGEVLPRGMRPRTSIVEDDGKEVEDQASVVDYGLEVDYAMATVVENAKGLQPTYEEARRRPDWPKWQEAIQKELSSLEKTGTWRLVKRPPGAKWLTVDGFCVSRRMLQGK
jgi:hypothetical protein